MKNWEEDDGEEYCTAAADLADAQAVCDKLGIELHTVNFAAEYWDNVFELFPPNTKPGARRTRTFCATKKSNLKPSRSSPQKIWAPTILRPVTTCAVPMSTVKPAAARHGRQQDQSYFLYTLSHEQIAQSLFPVGELEKPQVRKIAEDLDLITAKKKTLPGSALSVNVNSASSSGATFLLSRAKSSPLTATKSVSIRV